MLHTDFSTLDFSKYKRFFVIGCSFTQWHWPMWADVIHKQHPHLEFKNFGYGGAGNIYISSVLSQITLEYDLCETDLVGIMWSTFHRNDHYRSNSDLKPQIKNYLDNFFDVDTQKGQMMNWHSAGDMIGLQYTANKTLADDRGHLVRDCGIIHAATEMMKSAKYHSFQTISVGLRQQTIYDESITQTYKDDVYDLYEPYMEQHTIGGPMFTVEFDHVWDETVWWVPAWYSPEDAKTEPNHVDKHPSTVRWCNYLEKIGYVITPETREWAEKCDNRVKNTKHSLALVYDRLWPWNSMRTETGYLPV